MQNTSLFNSLMSLQRNLVNFGSIRGRMKLIRADDFNSQHFPLCQRIEKFALNKQ
jgi:hypothetical protein